MTEGSSALCSAQSPRRSSYPHTFMEDSLLARPRWWAEGGFEPPLDELLSDSVIQTVMRLDGTTRKQIEKLLAGVRNSTDTDDQPKVA